AALGRGDDREEAREQAAGGEQVGQQVDAAAARWRRGLGLHARSVAPPPRRRQSRFGAHALAPAPRRCCNRRTITLLQESCRCPASRFWCSSQAWWPPPRPCPARSTSG